MHALVDTAYDKMMQSKDLEDVGAKTPAAGTIQQTSSAPILEVQAKGPSRRVCG